jgi:uncharacterized protein (TIGR02646 family)
MIRIGRPAEAAALDQKTLQYLAQRQAKANSFPIRSEEIDRAWSGFLRTQARKHVGAAMDAYSHAKCAYCEQVAAKDIEHFYPKADYPPRMFLWANLLRACKNCNNAKLDHFPIEAGQHLLIDPASEDPINFILWDFETGRAVLNPSEPYRSRANITREMFDLDQEPLCEQRRRKLKRVAYFLARVVREDPISPDLIIRLREELHPSEPWLGIIRQLFLKSSPYSPMIEAARKKLPNIDDWTATWL